MKKERLIPIEKSKKIIRLDSRGPESKKTSPWVYIFGITGIASFLYCLAIALFMGYGTKFFLIWGALALVCGILSFLFARPRKLEKIPRVVRRIIMILFIVGMLIFVGVEAMIISGFTAVPKPGADYVIILGAQWKPSGPSYVLQKRLEAAVGYLEQNPDTKVIVSGGQGSNEPITEAEGMKQYLVKAGIAEERIIKEDTSTNTCENLNYSSNFLDKENDRVVVVTNNFHVFRACGIANHQGYEHVEGLSAGSYPGMLPNNLLREFFGVMKDTFVGNM